MQYFDTGKEYDTAEGSDLTDMLKQGYNHVFKVATSDTGYMIYWAPTESLQEFEIDTGIVRCPVTAMIDYKCDTVKGIYNT